jgi:hypothetical protein
MTGWKDKSIKVIMEREECVSLIIEPNQFTE